MVKKIRNSLKLVYSNVSIQDKFADVVRKINKLIYEIAGPEEPDGKEIKHDFKK